MRTTSAPFASFTLRFVLASLPLSAVLACTFAVFHTDLAAAQWFDNHRTAHPELKQAMHLISYWLHRLFYAAYGIALVYGLVRKKRSTVRFTLTWLAVQLVLNVAILHLLKMGIGRPRPGEGILFHPMTTDPDFHSLPSGHTADITTSGLAAALWNKSTILALGAGCLMALTGLSRIYLGSHYPSDVFFGWLLGTVGGTAVFLLATPTSKGES